MSILIADMCYHQVMAESMYNVFSKRYKTNILSNESLMTWPDSINKNDIFILSRSKSDLGALKRRIYRLLFLIKLFLIQKKYAAVIVTTGIEYAPRGLQLVSYFLYYLICRRSKVITVVHNIDFWEVNKKGCLKKKVLSEVLKTSRKFICLSDKISKNFAEKYSLSEKTVTAPFLTISKFDLDENHFNHLKSIDKKIVIVYQGTVNYKRKNCEILLSAFSKMSCKDRGKFKLIFQGPPIYEKDREFLCEISKLMDCDWRDYFLPYNKMKELIKSSHILIAPINSSFGYGEIKESGICFDAIRYMRPAIVPEGICSEEFLPFLKTYKTEEELLGLLKNLNKNTVEYLSKKLKEISYKYTNEYCSDSLSLLLFD